MASFFKKFGQGLLYVLVLPVFLVILALYAVYGIFIFLIMMVKSLISFFKGKSLYSDLPEDIEAKRRLAMINNPFDPKPQPQEEKRDPIVIIEKPSSETTIDIKEENPNTIEYKDTPSQVEFKTIPNEEEPPLISPRVFPDIHDTSIDEQIELEKTFDPEPEPDVKEEELFDFDEPDNININGEDDDDILPPDDVNNIYEDIEDDDK